MKKSWLSALLLAGYLSIPTQALAQPQIGNAEALLQKMGNTTQTATYELSFININSQGIVPIRYRHALVDGKPVAQLMQMDSTRREIVQRGNEISYFEPGLDAFSLRNEHIVDYLPAIIIKILLNSLSITILLMREERISATFQVVLFVCYQKIMTVMNMSYLLMKRDICH